MNSDIKPDFHCIHKARDGEYPCMHQCDYCKNHDALLSTVKRLQEEKKELVEALKLSQLFLKDVSSMKEVNGVVYDVNSVRTEISKVLNKEQLES